MGEVRPLLWNARHPLGGFHVWIDRCRSRRRLRYTAIVEKPALGLWAGVGAVVVAAPVVGLIGLVPIVGGLVGTPIAIAIGAGVGTGVALGVKDTKEPPKLLDD